MKNEPDAMRPFWQEYLIIMGIDAVVVTLLSLLFGGFHQLSNFFFYSTFILLVIAIIPIFSDFGSSGKAIKEMQKKGVRLSKEDEHFLTQQVNKDRRGSRQTFVYGLAAVTAFILSILTLGQ
jgi:hypothetical protein